jgi:DNA/RNA-binding domain of Phe-tRNA-synthetase-like protein
MSTFGHAADLREQYPELVAVAMRVDGITPSADVAAAVAAQTALARSRLDGRTESELPEIAAWRRVFARMGLKPTQYRCASEALLRRLRMDGELPRIHPLVDLANAVSMASALPVCVIDLDGVDGGILVRFAAGDERYQSFGGEIERPEPGEVVFRDDGGWAHARRWTNRQSGRSAVQATTSRVLIVSEGVHATASVDVPRAVETLAAGIGEAWGIATPVPLTLSADRPALEL